MKARRHARRASGRLKAPDGYRWRRNPYAAALKRSGLRVLAEALPADARRALSTLRKYAEAQGLECEVAFVFPKTKRRITIA